MSCTPWVPWSTGCPISVMPTPERKLVRLPRALIVDLPGCHMANVHLHVLSRCTQPWASTHISSVSVQCCIYWNRSWEPEIRAKEGNGPILRSTVHSASVALSTPGVASHPHPSRFLLPSSPAIVCDVTMLLGRYMGVIIVVISGVFCDACALCQILHGFFPPTCSRPCFFVDECIWARSFILLSFSFLIYKMKVILR